MKIYESEETDVHNNCYEQETEVKHKVNKKTFNSVLKIEAMNALEQVALKDPPVQEETGLKNR